jgi:hypothetical protein
MIIYRLIWIGLLSIGLTSGCGVQDSTQPHVGSISVGPRKDISATLPPGKAKAVQANRR